MREHELASTKKEGVPTDERVDDIFFAIIPDLPTPDNIIFPFLQLVIAIIALLKFLSIEVLNFCNDFISKGNNFLCYFFKFISIH